MSFMEQIALWNQNDQHQRIIDAIEALPREEQTPELISELARAYNNIAEVEDAPLFQKAISLLESVEDELGDDHHWNFRMAYAYYYLNQEGPALYYFEKALEAKPGDGDTLEMIDDCKNLLALPRFEKSFRERTAEGWASFLAGEAELRRMIAEKQDGTQVTKRCGELLAPAFDSIAFELGLNGEKYDLILTPEGSRAKLFQLVYFQRRVPAQVLEHWNILVGRQPSQGLALRMLDQELSAADVLVWTEKAADGQVSLSLYSEKLLPVLREDEGEAYWIISILLDQAIGELSAMELLDGYELLESPLDEDAAQPMDRLDEVLREQGLELILDPAVLLDRYAAYEMEPQQDPDADLRMDIFAGVSRCLPLMDQYFQNRSGLMDDFHRDGVACGFLYYPLDGFTQSEERGKQVLDFRDSVEAAVLEQAGGDAVTFTGGASGVYYGYLDFIAWDLRAVLDAAAEFFAQAPVEWAAFHTFRRNVGGGVTLKREAAQEE